MVGFMRRNAPVRSNPRHHILAMALAASAVPAIALAGTPVSAQPSPPGGTSDPMARYLELGAQAAKTDEDLLQAQDTLTKSQALRKQADADVAAAVKAKEEAKSAKGQAVPLNALTPGDLLFYDDGTGNPGAIHHVGMYVGSGKMVDASTEGQLVDVRAMKGDGHLIGARRIVG
jgi:uncharacterized protein YycO